MMSIEIIDRKTATHPKESEVVISVDRLSKKFCRDLKQSLFYGIQDITTDLVGGRRKSDTLRPGEFWALKDIDFQLRRGEALGLVGANGAGKSTLLRIISGLIKPDTGSVKIRGRVAPLIALGAGFNPILTGRENIYANMSILGLSTQEIKERFQDVIDFAEIWNAIDAPVQTYSSGMAARLGFACAIYTEPEILLIDEVLAVGDIKFKAKCYRKLHELRDKGTSFILVNHNPQAILHICDFAVYLSKGELIVSGKTEKVIEKYENDLFLNDPHESSQVLFLPEKTESESLGLDIRSLFFRDLEGNIIKSLVSGKPVNFCVGCQAHQRVDNVTLHLKIKTIGGEGGMGTVLFLSGEHDEKFFEIPSGKQELQVELPYLGLGPGTYTMSIKLKQSSIYTFDVVESFRFTVKSNGKMSECCFYQPRLWKLASPEKS
ncbi:ABC transporter ATP-binding protein [Chroococcidiopsis sp. CCALA 051]|nr:ABC transporter ATP-binding protein [Chroococcidiopsis sp. CCALA 051]